MMILTWLSIYMFITYAQAVMEQGTDDKGNIIWKQASYRNRDVVPVPEHFDMNKKHKREVDVDDDSEDDDDDTTTLTRARPSKKSFIRTHFALPLGAEFPMSYSEKVQQRKNTKKSSIQSEPLQEKLAGEANFNVLPVDHIIHRGLSRSGVPKTWGLTWRKYPTPESYHIAQGYGRSTLEGLNKNGKISEEEFDSGLMGRGLGGMKERAQNENLMEEKFAEKMDDENDAEVENSRSRVRRFIFFPSYLHHYHHHHHGRRRQRRPQPQQNDRHPNHPAVDFPSANSSTLNNTSSIMTTLINQTPLIDQRVADTAPLLANQNVTTVTVNNPAPKIDEDVHQRQFKQVEEGRVTGAQGGDSIRGKETNSFEYQPQFGDKPDFEYDKQTKYGPDGSPWQYMNHNPHHNVFNQHMHAPYKMHAPHDDYKNQHPAHPFEEKMEGAVGSNYNFSTPLLDANKIEMKKRMETANRPLIQQQELPFIFPVKSMESTFEQKIAPITTNNRPNRFRDMLKHFLFIGGKIAGRHTDEDLSPAEVINWKKR